MTTVALAPTAPSFNPFKGLAGFFSRRVNSNRPPCGHDVAGSDSPFQVLSGFDRLVVILKEFVDFDNSRLERAEVCRSCGKVALDFGRAKLSRGSRVHRVLIINDPEVRSWQDLSGQNRDDYLAASLFILNGQVQKHCNNPVGYLVTEEAAR